MQLDLQRIRERGSAVRLEQQPEFVLAHSRRRIGIPGREYDRQRRMSTPDFAERFSSAPCWRAMTRTPFFW